MKEPDIVKAINLLEDISDEEKARLTSIVLNVFYYDPDDYYSFMEKMQSLQIDNLDDFFANFKAYLEVRKKIEDQLNSIRVKNNVARGRFEREKSYCADLKHDLNGLIRARDLIQNIIKRFDSDEIQDLIALRDEVKEQVDEVNGRVSAKKNEAKTRVDELLADGDLFSYIKAKLVRKRYDKKISSIESERDLIDREFASRCQAIVSIFHDEVDNISEEDKELLTRHKDLGGYENFFAIKYDLTFYLHNNVPGRLFDFIEALSSEITSYQQALNDELESAGELKKRIDKREEIISSYMDHLDVFNVSDEEAKLFKDYTKRYPNLEVYSKDELVELDEQQEARVLLPIISTLPVKHKTKSLTR